MSFPGRNLLRKLTRGLPLTAAVLVLPAIGQPASAASSTTTGSPHVQLRLIADVNVAAPGERFTLGLQQRIAPGWHTYWKNPGDSGLATQLHWQLPTGVEVGALQWPAPQRQPFGPVMNYGYEGEVTLLTDIQLPASLPTGQPLRLQARAEWLVCKDVCIPESAELRLDLPVAAHSAPARHEDIEAARRQLPQPAVWPTRFSRDQGTLILNVDSGPLPAGSTAWFFPTDWGVLEHAAPQRLHSHAQGIDLQLTPAAALGPDAPARLQGVLVIEPPAGTGLHRQAYEIDAPPDPPPAANTPAAAPATVPDAVDIGLAAAIGLALLGGLILNLMPCVFPVLAMKVMGLLRHGGEPVKGGRHGAGAHAMAYMAGVLASFAILAVVVLILQAGGNRLGWGFQFQSPLFVLLVGWLLFAVGLNLSGIFTLGSRLAGAGQGLASRPGRAGSFFTGVLAAVVATPCTAPFMGVAIGYAMTQPPAALLAIFLSLGLGLALPFGVLVLKPGLLARLPRPGPWMLRLKQALAFPMYAAAVWLVWVLALQRGAAALPLALGGMVLIALAAWLHEISWPARPGLRRACRLTALALLIGCLLAAVRLLPPAPDTAGTPAAPSSTRLLPVEPWSAGRVAELRSQGRPVFVNFTAAWCITCLVNEQVALERPEVAAAFAAHDTAYLKGDWTNQDPAISTLLASFGRSGVPLYLYYPANTAQPPEVLPQLLTAERVLHTLQAAAPRAER